MRTWRQLIVCFFSMLALGAAELERPLQVHSNGFLTGFNFDVHTALPIGTLAQDVNDQLGFGFSLGYRATLGSRVAIRTSIRWTGYRVSDRNLGARFLASLFDASYDEDRLILRSYALGGDFLAYRDEHCLGPYFLAGGGIQRSRMYYEHRSVDEQGNEVLQNLAVWPSADTPFWNVGVGYLGQSAFFIEGRVVMWRYRAEPGVQLMQTSLNAANQLRDAVSVVAAIGLQF